MKYFKFLFLLSNLIIFLGFYAETKEKVEKENELFESNKLGKTNHLISSIKWEIIDRKDYYLDNPIQWEFVPENYYPEEKQINFKNSKSPFNNQILKQIYEISPLIPTNNFIARNNFESKVEWKSTFGGGKAGGTGQQNNSFRMTYGLNDFTQLTAYFAEADDDTYRLINGKSSNYHWQNYALSLKRKIFNSNNSKSTISFVPSLEYFKTSSGSKTTKSIFNQINDSLDKDKFGKILYSFSFPFTKQINKNLHYTLVPGFISLPNKLGNRTSGNNYYGNNFFLGNGITYKLFEDLTLTGSYTNPLGPGNNHFDKNLNFMRKPIYSFGLSWDINNKIGIETKLTNGFGSTPATGILTLPSDNVPIYSANIKYNPKGEDTYLKPLNERENFISHGGITVNNALIPKSGSSQYSLNYDSKGNYFGSYSYSLSNIFQLELINLGRFRNENQIMYFSDNFNNTYLDNNNFHIRLGGKLLLFSPQKNDILWSSIRTSVGRNESSNQGYILSELINTYRINNWLAANLSSKYFLSGVEKFGAIGASMYINVTDNIQIIPEMNYSLDKDLKSNNTISIRYSLNENKSFDLYLSNAVGTQDLGQLLKAKDNKIGFKLNLLY